jgi:tRNA G37 N-methylase Trm5
MEVDSNNHLTNDQKQIIKEVMQQYSTVISKDKYDVGRVNMPLIDTSIQLTPDAIPKFIPERNIANHLNLS